jgi:hypothetical protein
MAFLSLSVYPFLALTGVFLLFLLTRYRRGRLSSSSRSSQPLDSKSAPSNPPFSSVFPPTNREGLLRLTAAGETAHVFPSTIDPQTFQSKLIAWDADYRSYPDGTVLLSGITLGEVRSLGDFPDYWVLSDVPEPEEYTGFELDKAVHRPYRPFRWGYYQTMCTVSLATPESLLTLRSSTHAARAQLVA